jgi:hypothetical protein
MIAVWHSLMSATRPVDMAIFMVYRLTLIWIGFIDLKAMLIIVIAMLVVHVTIMQIINVISMFDLGVTTALTCSCWWFSCISQFWLVMIHSFE